MVLFLYYLQIWVFFLLRENIVVFAEKSELLSFTFKFNGLISYFANLDVFFFCR